MSERPNNFDSVIYHSEQEGYQRSALLFQGQGTQEPGMGRELADANSKIARLYQRAKLILSYSLPDLTADELSQTLYAQPAIFVHSEACRQVLMAQRKLKPMFYAGNSLGELNALLAAGAFSFDDGLLLVRARAKGMQMAAESYPGGLLAVVEKPGTASQLAQITAQLQQLEVFPGIFNSETQITFGGASDALAQAQNFLETNGYLKNGLRAVRLNVAGAFHTPLMEGAKPYLEEALNAIKIRRIRKPVIANTTASPITTPDEIKKELLDQLTEPVLWQQTIEFIEAQGTAATVELGKRGILTNMMRHKGQVAALTAGVAGTGIAIATLLYLRRRA